jgi:hypothetical protein
MSRRIHTYTYARHLRQTLALVFLGLTLWAIPGCATNDDAENLSERPWNSPKSWEHGLPVEMMEGR